MSDLDLATLERQTFRAANDDGLWDVFIAIVVAMFAIAPLLSERLGDFWSAAVFVPVWFATYVGIRLIRTAVVAPRLGTVTPGQARARRLRRLGRALTIVCLLTFAAGVAVAMGVATGRIDPEGLGYPIAFGVASLIGLSLVAHVTGVVRHAIYGLMLAVAPLIGEWLWRSDLAEHHGYPIVFGTCAAIIFVVGVVRFFMLMRGYSVPPDGELA